LNPRSKPMNRRSFIGGITKALAGLAALPLVGKLLSSAPPVASYEQTVLSYDPILYWRMDDLGPVDKITGLWVDDIEVTLPTHDFHLESWIHPFHLDNSSKSHHGRYIFGHHQRRDV
jgi:hypothetical protein